MICMPYKVERLLIRWQTCHLCMFSTYRDQHTNLPRCSIHYIHTYWVSEMTVDIEALTIGVLTMFLIYLSSSSSFSYAIEFGLVSF